MGERVEVRRRRPHLLDEEIGRRVARARADAGLSQWQLAEALDCNETTIGRMERGHSLPGVVFLLRVCDDDFRLAERVLDRLLPKKTVRKRARKR